MSKFLSFECDPVDQPHAHDLVERRTWCAMRIRVGRNMVSRVWDKSLEAERTTLYLPAFPVAEWLVRNWWPLLNELCLWDSPPNSPMDETKLNWIQRHCLRAADSALLLPALYLFHDGRGLRAEWRADAPDSLPNMPGEFVDTGTCELDSDATQTSLTQFIGDVLSRVRDVDDERVRQVTNQWNAIQGADSEERNFCVLAGRMGIDPYDADEMTEELAAFFENLASPETPLVRDLTEIARPESVEGQWQWIENTNRDLQLSPMSSVMSLTMPSRQSSPHQFGYDLARGLRKAGNITPESPLDSVENIVEFVTGKRLRVEDRNHIPGQGIRAIVGESSTGDIVTAGPPKSHPDSRRFLTARSAYHALGRQQDSQRLVTTALSWDQKASRAFAAELLAPQQALADRISTSADPEMIAELSQEFQASTRVIERQLENFGISLASE